MSATGIQGQTLEVRVVGCNRLKDTEWFSRQDPYVCLEYGGSKFLSSICTDGGKNPTFQEKFRITLVEGLREINVAVWNSNAIAYDNLIGSGKVQIQEVLSKGFHDNAWTIQGKTNRYAGEVHLIMYYSNANKLKTGPQCCAAPPPPPQVPLYPAPPPAAPLYPAVYPYPPQPSMYPPTYPPTYPPQPAVAYPPQPYPPQAYPPQPYPPQSNACYPPNAYQAYPRPY